MSSPILNHEQWVGTMEDMRQSLQYPQRRGYMSGHEVRCQECPWSWAVPLSPNEDDWRRQQFYAEEHMRQTGHRTEGLTHPDQWQPNDDWEEGLTHPDQWQPNDDREE